MPPKGCAVSRQCAHIAAVPACDPQCWGCSAVGAETPKSRVCWLTAWAVLKGHWSGGPAGARRPPAPLPEKQGPSTSLVRAACEQEVSPPARLRGPSRLPGGFRGAAPIALWGLSHSPEQVCPFFGRMQLQSGCGHGVWVLTPQSARPPPQSHSRPQRHGGPTIADGAVENLAYRSITCSARGNWSQSHVPVPGTPLPAQENRC